MVRITRHFCNTNNLLTGDIDELVMKSEILVDLPCSLIVTSLASQRCLLIFESAFEQRRMVVFEGQLFM